MGVRVSSGNARKAMRIRRDQPTPAGRRRPFVVIFVVAALTGGGAVVATAGTGTGFATSPWAEPNICPAPNDVLAATDVVTNTSGGSANFTAGYSVADWTAANVATVSLGAFSLAAGESTTLEAPWQCNAATTHTGYSLEFTVTNTTTSSTVHDSVSFDVLATADPNSALNCAGGTNAWQGFCLYVHGPDPNDHGKVDYVKCMFRAVDGAFPYHGKVGRCFWFRSIDNWYWADGTLRTLPNGPAAYPKTINVDYNQNVAICADFVSEAFELIAQDRPPAPCALVQGGS